MGKHFEDQAEHDGVTHCLYGLPDVVVGATEKMTAVRDVDVYQQDRRQIQAGVGDHHVENLCVDNEEHKSLGVWAREQEG